MSNLNLYCERFRLPSLEGECVYVILVCWRAIRAHSRLGLAGDHAAAGKDDLDLHVGFFTSHISSPAARPSPAFLLTLSGPLEPSDPSVQVALTSTLPVPGQCHPQRGPTSRLDVPCTQGPKSSASLCLMTRWNGVRTGRSIILLATPTLL